MEGNIVGMRETEVQYIQILQIVKGGMVGPRYRWNGMLDSPAGKAAATSTQANRQRSVLCIMLLSANNKQVDKRSGDIYQELRSLR